MSLLDERKCAICGGDLGVTYQIIRGFYPENGEIVEDTNLELMGPPTFTIWCQTHSEDEWEPKDLPEAEDDALHEWKKSVIDAVLEKFFQD
jgi:hypothetical protein